MTIIDVIIYTGAPIAYCMIAGVMSVALPHRAWYRRFHRDRDLLVWVWPITIVVEVLRLIGAIVRGVARTGAWLASWPARRRARPAPLPEARTVQR